MTGRELIRQIVDSCNDLDADIPFTLLQRDLEDGCVDKKLVIDDDAFQIVNGKMYVEWNRIPDNGIV